MSKRKSPSSATEETGSAPKAARVESKDVPGLDVMSDTVSDLSIVACPDVYIVTPTMRLGVNRVNLASKSEVFKTMIETVKDSKELPLTGFKDTVIVEACNYMHTPSFATWCGPPKPDLYEELVSFADKYAIVGLLSICETYLIQNYQHNASALAFAGKYKLESFEKAVISTLVKMSTSFDLKTTTTLTWCSPQILVRFINSQRQAQTENETKHNKLIDDIQSLLDEEHESGQHDLLLSSKVLSLILASRHNRMSSSSSNYSSSFG